jgi:hypothetical protein
MFFTVHEELFLFEIPTNYLQLSSLINIYSCLSNKYMVFARWTGEYLYTSARSHQKEGGNIMDFLTALAYWGMAALVVINAIIVLRMKVDIGDGAEDESDPTKCQTGI